MNLFIAKEASYLYSLTMEHWKIHIKGNVQGVGFRSAARQQAEESHVTGFARNEPDGSVYIEAEGNPRDLEQFYEWCRQGSEAADVEKVQIDKHENVKNHDAFKTF